ncbi:hypothetical protein CesoFtcFv8_020126 [Champsocephalus esox]|uniref:Uncharacterized protein n=1 Tax=Champsocephalus esox TaxID=159716 RepID=A0AAN8BF98_9TELE|nr:hypothetical protein CesoFtcFv8_020126 [Champsocephalus esox]
MDLCLETTALLPIPSLGLRPAKASRLSSLFTESLPTMQDCFSIQKEPKENCRQVFEVSSAVDVQRYSRPLTSSHLHFSSL